VIQIAQVSTTLLVNGRVHSPTHPDATAMAVRGDVVAWLGSDDVGRSQFPGAQVVDLDGGFVAPGFVDSHIHLSATGLTLSGLDLRHATSRAHCVQMVADYAAAHPGQPVWGHGWDESAWPENTAPSTADLDAVLGDRPAYLSRVDVHSALASTGLRRRVPELPVTAGFAAEQPLAGDAHHLIRAVARGLLTAEQLYALPGFTRYWRSLSNVPEPQCGFVLNQVYPTTSFAGVSIDYDYAQLDYEARSATWLAAA